MEQFKSSRMRARAEECNEKHELLRMPWYAVEASDNRSIKRCVFEIEEGGHESRQPKGKYIEPEDEQCGSDS